MLSKGDCVAELAFQDAEGNLYALADFEGKRAVAIFFYPMDFSPGCTREVCHFRDHHQEMRDLGAEVFGVSRDSAESHAKFRAKHGLGFPLIADEDGSLAKAFGTGRLGGLLGNKRVTFVVKPDSEIIEAIHSELSMVAHVECVIEVLKALKE